MTQTFSAAAEPRQAATENIPVPRVAPFDVLLERTRTTWMAGDFGRIAVSYASGAEARAELGEELVKLWKGRNGAIDGTTSVASEYLEIQIDVA